MTLRAIVDTNDLHIENLAEVLTASDVTLLRRGYDATALIDLKMSATAAPYPALEPWVTAIGATFFENDALPARDRELCLITLLAYRAPGLSLGTHIYAGLMEGLRVEEICQAIGLSGCYGGLPAFTESISSVRRTLLVLKRCAAGPVQATRAVLEALVSARPS